MTDIAPPSGVARFGVSYTGPSFIWSWLETGEDGELRTVEGTFRAHPGLSFDEQLDYQSDLSIVASENTIGQVTMAQEIERWTKQRTAGEIDDETLMNNARQLAEQTRIDERAWFERMVDITLRLVHPGDREKLRPHLLVANASDLRDLRNHLVKVTIDRTVQAVQAAAQVDPT